MANALCLLRIQAALRPGVMLLAVVCATASAVAPAAAQTASRRFDEFRRTAAQASSSRSLQVRLLWSTQEPVRDPSLTANRLRLLSIERVATRSMPSRGTGVASGSLLAALEDSNGRVVAWRAVRDPRIVRAESSSPPVLNGRTLYYLQTELLLVLPDVAAAARLRLYSVGSWEGVAVLRSIGTVALR